MTSKRTLFIPLTAAALCLGLAAPALAESVTVVSWGGSYQDSQRKAYFEPFIAGSGVALTESEYNGEIGKIRAMVESKSVDWDVVDVGSQNAVAGCDEGILEEIDWKKLGHDPARFIGGDVSPCAVPTILYSTVLAYDTTKFPEGPKTVADLFDLQKFPGKRSLRKVPSVNLEWALIADGVPTDQVYEVLSTPEGVDRAFAKLDTIKSDIIWWEAGAQPPQLLADGQAVIVSAYNGRIYSAVANDNKPFRILWDHQVLAWDWWVIPKGTPNLDAAYKFIAFASDPGPQAEQTKYISYGPANRDALPNVDPAILPHLPTAPDNMGTAFPADIRFWADHGEELEQRFHAWLAQ